MMKYEMQNEMYEGLNTYNLIIHFNSYLIF